MSLGLAMAEFVCSGRAQQRAYRQLLSALSYPGTIQEISADHCQALWLLLASLADENVLLADVHQLVPEFLSACLACGRSDVQSADIAIFDSARPPTPFDQPRVGDLYQPHLGATVIWRCEHLGQGPLKLSVSGPGVASVATFCVTGLSVSWLEARGTWVSRFPMGADILICDAQRIVGLPRTTVVNYSIEN